MNPTQKFILAIFFTVFCIAAIYTWALQRADKKNRIPNSPIKPEHKKEFNI